MTERPDTQKVPNPISGEYEGYYNGKLRETIESALVTLAQETRDDIGLIVGGKCGLLEISGAVAGQLAKAGVLRPFVTVFAPTAVVTDYVVVLDSKIIPPSSHPQTRLELRAAGNGLQRDFTRWVLERRKIEFNQ